MQYRRFSYIVNGLQDTFGYRKHIIAKAYSNPKYMSSMF